LSSFIVLWSESKISQMGLVPLSQRDRADDSEPWLILASLSMGAGSASRRRLTKPLPYRTSRPQASSWPIVAVAWKGFGSFLCAAVTILLVVGPSSTLDKLDNLPCCCWHPCAGQIWISFPYWAVGSSDDGRSNCWRYHARRSVPVLPPPWYGTDDAVRC
jgi:hypothetical protein